LGVFLAAVLAVVFITKSAREALPAGALTPWTQYGGPLVQQASGSSLQWVVCRHNR
jgi:hypothetical protein